MYGHNKREGLQSYGSSDCDYLSHSPSPSLQWPRRATGRTGWSGAAPSAAGTPTATSRRSCSTRGPQPRWQHLVTTWKHLVTIWQHLVTTWKHLVTPGNTWPPVTADTRHARPPPLRRGRPAGSSSRCRRPGCSHRARACWPGMCPDRNPKYPFLKIPHKKMYERVVFVLCFRCHVAQSLRKVTGVELSILGVAMMSFTLGRFLEIHHIACKHKFSLILWVHIVACVPCLLPLK